MKKALIYVLIAVMSIAVGVAIAHAQEPRTWQVRLAWDPNTEEDLAGYSLYHSHNSGGPYEKSQDIPAGTEEYVETVEEGIHFWVLTAFDTSRNESGYSNEVSVELDGTAPAAPGGLQRFLDWLEGLGFEIKKLNVVAVPVEVE